MTVQVTSSKQILITDFRPQADTTYEHTGAYYIGDQIIDLLGYEPPADRKRVYLDGAVYRIAHRHHGDSGATPSVMAPSPFFELDGTGYLTVAHDVSQNCPRAISMFIQMKWNDLPTGNHAGIISKGVGATIDWELFFDTTTREVKFYDSVNGTTASGLYVKYQDWSTVGVTVIDDDIIFWVDDGTAPAVKTAATATARPVSGGDLYIGRSSVAGDMIKAYVSSIYIWDVVLDNNAMLNAIDNLKIQEEELIIGFECPTSVAATISDTATEYRVDM